MTTSNPPFDPQDLSKQPTFNIGVIGHVSHGKSTLITALTGINPSRFRSEKEQNKTIQLGYSNFKIYKCLTCERPNCYHALPSDTMEVKLECPNENCDSEMVLVRHVSLIDSPGHNELMTTMLSGSSVMDTGLLMIDASQSCPQPQTLEHLIASEIMEFSHMLIVQNKIDLLQPSYVYQNQTEIKQLVAGTIADNSSIIPISAIKKIQLDVLCEYICRIPHPIRNPDDDLKMFVIRSFDVNRPKSNSDSNSSSIIGGVIGGSIIQGVLKLGDEIEIRPGLIEKNSDGKYCCQPIKTKVVSLMSDKNKLDFAVPGGLIAIGTELDPQYTKRDRLKGQVVGHPGKLPDIFIDIEISYNILKSSSIHKISGNQKKTKIKLELNDKLVLTIGSKNTIGVIKVLNIGQKVAQIRLKSPICSPINEKVVISKELNGSWRVIGKGHIIDGNPISIKSLT